MVPKKKYSCDKLKLCNFYKDHDHNTKSCIHLKWAIERLIYEGALAEYKAN